MPHGKARADHDHAGLAGQHVKGLRGVAADDEHRLAVQQPHLAVVVVQAHLCLGGGVQLQRAAVGQVDVQRLAARGGVVLLEDRLAAPVRPAQPAATDHGHCRARERGLRHEAAEVEQPVATAGRGRRAPGGR